MKGTDHMTDLTDTTDTADTSDVADYEKTLLVHAAPDALFNALTTTDGLSSWWSQATGSGETGGQLKFLMSDPLVMRVVAAVRPVSVQWTVTACDFLPDWVGTRPTFTITAIDDATSELHFRHRGLTEELDCIEMCSQGWDHFLRSLRGYVETGRGSPRGSEADQARKARELSDAS
jgi:uncharacterized protein YndB with AHSA1/START domain